MKLPQQEHWSGLPFPPPGDHLDPGIKLSSPVVVALSGEFFTTEPPGKSSIVSTPTLKLIQKIYSILAFINPFHCIECCNLVFNFNFVFFPVFSLWTFVLLSYTLYFVYIVSCYSIFLLISLMPWYFLIWFFLLHREHSFIILLLKIFYWYFFFTWVDHFFS